MTDNPNLPPRIDAAPEQAPTPQENTQAKVERIKAELAAEVQRSNGTNNGFVKTPQQVAEDLRRLNLGSPGPAKPASKAADNSNSRMLLPWLSKDAAAVIAFIAVVGGAAVATGIMTKDWKNAGWVAGGGVGVGLVGAIIRDKFMP
ncbi:MAG TPA: hypothetical protein PKW15_03585 [Alphaproteobacteria bacterium]|nr:hypothetical protein [Rhodospirillaceae bacterium]HRJ12309.1 hypothetical protein [Alphaproteobacteria bacterium]